MKYKISLLERTATPRELYNMWKFMHSESKHDFLCHSRHRIRSRDTFTRNRKPFIKRSSEQNSKSDSRERSRSPSHRDNFNQKKLNNPSNLENKMVLLQQYVRTLEEEKRKLMCQKNCMKNMIKERKIQLLKIKNSHIQRQSPTSNSQNNGEVTVPIGSREFDLMKTVQELKERCIEMSKRIKIMEKREAVYLGTLMQVDEICAEMEIGYKQHCYLAEQNEAEMRDKLQSLKGRKEF